MEISVSPKVNIGGIENGVPSSPPVSGLAESAMK